MSNENQYVRKCPECGETLNRDARRCACGWGARAIATGPKWNHVCTWHSGSLSCTYPVGRFDEGMHSGWCIFHRHTGEGYAAARIAEESHSHTQDSYLAAAKRLTYGSGSDNPAVAAMRAGLRKQAGNVGAMLPERLRQREPGEDG